jgi:hypothetical protein
LFGDCAMSAILFAGEMRRIALMALIRIVPGSYACGRAHYRRFTTGR